MSSKSNASGKSSDMGHGGARGVRGVIIVLLGRLGLPPDVARKIYAWRRVDYNATYWWLMGQHYTIAARHNHIVRRPLSLGGARGAHYMTVVRYGGYPSAVRQYQPLRSRRDRYGWLEDTSRMLYDHNDRVIAVHLESRASMREPSAGAMPFAEYCIWLTFGVQYTGGTADCYDRVYAAARSELSIEHAYALDAWGILMPGLDIDDFDCEEDPETLELCVAHVARIMSESDYSSWQRW